MDANSEFVERTEIQHFGILSLAKLNEVRLGGEFAPDQRLSGLSKHADACARRGKQRAKRTHKTFAPKFSISAYSR